MAVIQQVLSVFYLNFIAEILWKQENWLEVAGETRKAVIKGKVIKGIKKMGIGHFEL